MLKALAGGLGRLAKNPLLLLPAFASIGILLAVFFLFLGVTTELIIDLLFLEVFPEGPLSAFPFQFVALYPVETLALLVFSLVSGVVFVSLNYWYAFYVKESFEGRASFGGACSETVSAMGKVLAFFVFALVIMLFVGVLVWVFLLVASLAQVLGLALMLVLFLGLFYLYVKLAFVVQAMALEQGSVKQALQQSWELGLGRFWIVFLFLFLVGLVAQIFSFVGSYFADMVLDDILATVILVVFWGVGLAFAGLAMALFYAEKKLGKSI